MKANPSWYKRVLPGGFEPEKTKKQIVELPTKVDHVDDHSPTVPDLRLLHESPLEIEMSLSFDPYDKGEISKK